MSINLNISSLANGGVQEKINRELEKIVENIMDPNTSTKDKRKLVVTLTFEPNDNRDTVKTSVNIKPTFAAQTDVGTTILTGKDFKTGDVYANELKSGSPGQTFFDDDGYLRTDTGEPIEDESTVIDFNKQRKTK